ncbi:hypothetical protein F4604DRAFT_1675524 [Suillus subluteus]|nr:hypothetical protein F4604DRAFT_1675524 [Suillus subluteus]
MFSYSRWVALILPEFTAYKQLSAGARNIKQWDRLSNTLAFLATMCAVILTISPPAPPLAFSVWLGAAGLSTRGLLIVQYFHIQAFSISDEDMGELSLALSYSPSGHLFFLPLDIVDYIIENSRGKPQFMLLSLVPVIIGFMASAAVMTIGSVIVEARCKRKLM